MDLQLLGKVALVTGGSKGIGKEIARQLALEGAEVAICARTEGALKATAKELSQESERRVLPFVADVSNRESVDRMVAQVVEAFGRLDILVNNAGFPGGLATGPLETVTDEAMHQDLNTKYLGALRCARAVAPHMRQRQWGRMVHIGGGSARVSGAYSTGARNIAVVHMSKTLSDELGPWGITSNVVHPALTRTPYMEGMVANRSKTEGRSVADIEAELGRNNAVRRVIDAREVAYVVAFLASPKSCSITGEVIGVGGGAGRAVTT